MPLIPPKNHRSPRKAAAAANAFASALVAPTAGLNYRDSFITLGPKDAVALNNFIAQPTGVVLRDGYRKYVTGLGGVVNSILGYLAQDATQNKLFAAVEGNIFDVTDSAESPTAVATNDSVDGAWSSVMFNGPTRNFLCCTNPSGGYWTYDDADDWQERTANLTGFSGVAGPIASWKNRLFIIASGTAKAYYLDVNSIQGPAHELDLGPLLKHGGYLAGVVNWTLNAGIDIDDYLVFFGSQGDVIVYQGTDPSDISTFALKGIWYMGRPPVGSRFWCEYGGELFVLSELGLLPLSKMVNGEVANTYTVMSAKIQPRLSPLVTSLINDPYWEVRLCENNDVLMIVPPRDITGHTQFVMYIQTGAWSTFSGMPINTMTTYNGQMYFGDEDGNVYLGLYGLKDGVEIDGTGGDDVVGQAQGGFNDFGSPANLKLFNMARPIFIAEQAPAVQAQINIEYKFNPIYAEPTFNVVEGSVWDTAHWDEAVWTGETGTYASWVGLQGMGYYGSLRVAVKGRPGTTYVSSTIMYQPGGVM